MRKIIALLIAFACLMGACVGTAAADENALDIGELSNRYNALGLTNEVVDGTDSVVVSTRVGVLTAVNRALDGNTVSFSGEVVGDIMAGGDGHKWLNVLGSDGNCIGVWVTDDEAARVVNKGNYATTGSILQIRGIYSIDCKDHQGELDVHALNIRVVDAGGAITHYVDDGEINLSLQICGIGFVLIVCFFLLRWYYDRRDAGEDSDSE